MGITPISNLPPLQLARSIESDLELMPMSRVEDSARTGEETYSPSEQQAAPSADDSQEEVLEEEIESTTEDDDAGQDGEPSEKPSERRISFLA
jgi:hypothetical protein